MGYTIPGADYTIGPDGIGQMIANTGKSIASSLSAGFAQRQRNKAAAEKVKREQSQTRSEWMKLASQKKKDFQASLKAAGLKDTASDTDLFDQFSNKIDTYANNALDANQALMFGDFDSDDKIKMPVGFMGNTEEKMYSRSELTDQVTFFETYSTTGKKQLGELLADTDMLNSPELLATSVVTGNQTNGEAFINEIALKNIGVGGDGSLLGKGVTSSRNLIVENGENIIESIVRVPKNSMLIQGNKTSMEALLANPLEGFKVDPNTGEYIFSSKINLTGYGTKDGMDLIVPAIETLPASQTMTDVGIFKDNGLRDTYVSPDVLSESKTQREPTTDKVGLESRTELQVVNMGKIRTNTDLLKKINSTYTGIFEDATVTEAQRNRYLLDLGIPESFGELQKQKGEDLKAYLIDYMTSSLIDEFVEDVDYEGNARLNAFTLEEGSDLLKYVEENPDKVGNYYEYGKDPRPYQAGDTIYALNTTSINQLAKVTEKVDNRPVNKVIYDELDNFDPNNPGRFEVPDGIKIPGSDTRFRYEKDADPPGFYYLDDSGVKTSRITNPKALFSAYK